MLALVDNVCNRSAGKVTFTTNFNMTKPSFFENKSNDFMAKPRNEYPLNKHTLPMTDMASKEDEGSTTTSMPDRDCRANSFSYSYSFSSSSSSSSSSRLCILRAIIRKDHFLSKLLKSVPLQVFFFCFCGAREILFKIEFTKAQKRAAGQGES